MNVNLPNPSARPNRLPLVGWLLIVLLLAVSFFSGVSVWAGQVIQAEDMFAPAWLHPALVLHGCLFPVQCIIFGILLAHHIRVGWQLRANLISGFAMELVFAGLILSGVGLYYVGAEEWRERLVWAHRILGLLLPITLAAHVVLGIRWGRQAERTARRG